MKLFVYCLIILFFIAYPEEALAQQDDQFRIDYFGNMGVAISRNDSVVFIDAFHSFYKDAYLPTSTGKFRDVLTKTQPFGTAVATLVTHYHGDHSDPRMLGEVMDAHSRMWMISGQQVVEQIQPRPDRKERFIIVSDSIHKQVAPGVLISAFKTWHVNYSLAERFRKTDNYFFVIEWAGKVFVHLGDTELVDRNFNLLNKWKGKVDVLLAPQWVVEDPNGAKLVTRYIEPKHIVMIHISPDEAGKDVKPLMPATVFFNYADFMMVK